MAAEGAQELTELERQLLEDRESRSFKRSEVPERVWNRFENLLFERVKIPKESALGEIEDEE